MNERKRLNPVMMLCAAMLFVAGAGIATAEEPVVSNETKEAQGPAVEASATVPGTDQVLHEGMSAQEESAAILKDLAMMAFVDKETGALRAPTPAEVKKLSAAGQRLRSLSAHTRLQVREFGAASGGTAAEVPPELHSHSLAEIAEDGETHLRCSDSAKAGDVLLSNPAAEEVE